MLIGPRDLMRENQNPILEQPHATDSGYGLQRCFVHSPPPR
jgi:hypothetical protein